MTPERLLRTAIAPALAELSGDNAAVRRFLLAIALQESGLQHRRQVGRGGAENGPASGWWQFEKNGACREVLTHKRAAPRMRAICTAYNVLPDAPQLWEAIRYQDVVAAAAARLLISTLPDPLPTNADDGWEQYLRAWRPGKPHVKTWAAHWATATATIEAQK